ncbi:MAG: hypothetical protein KKD01_19830, partial [Proteobacteria bacterium]|nr:hypothetical protein [Pseudomonadota bacterium]
MGDILSAFPEDKQDTGLPVDQAMSAPDVLSAFPDDVKFNQSVQQGVATPPDKAARVLKMQYKTGLPVGLIERNLDQVEEDARQANFNAEKFRAESPMLAAWMEQDKNRTALAKNDLGNLSYIEKIWNAYGHGFA